MKSENFTRRDFVAASVGVFAAAKLFGAGIEGGKELVRFGIATDSHYGEFEPTKPPGEVRAFAESLGKMRECVSVLNARKADFLVELGDYIEAFGSRAERLLALERIEKEFSQFGGARYHVLGNHDFQALKKEDFLSRIENTGIARDRTYYSFVRNGVTFMVLDHGFGEDGSPYRPGFSPWDKGRLSEVEFEWACRTIRLADGPVVVFSHWRLDPAAKAGYQALDALRLRKVMEESGKVKSVISGHYHYGYAARHNGICYYSLKAMVTGSGEGSSSYGEVKLYESGEMSVTGFRRAEPFGGI